MPASSRRLVDQVDRLGPREHQVVVTRGEGGHRGGRLVPRVGDARLGTRRRVARGGGHAAILGAVEQ